VKDHIAQVAARVAEASKEGTGLEIRGGGTKRFLGNPPTGEVLEVGDIRGIIEHDPSELFVTAYGGTKIDALDAALAEANQMLGFEPPMHGAESSIGGVLACGLSGPRRPSSGACRDFMLGVTMIDGSGEVLSFGGKVIKNVAGFDVTRLMAGSMGAFGVIVEVTMRVVAKPIKETTVSLELSEEQAALRANEIIASGLPVSASCWHSGALRLRLSGSEAGVKRSVDEIGGEVVREQDSDPFWKSIRNQTHPFFSPGRSLWKITTPPLADPIGVEGESLVEWNGALRWVSTDMPPEIVRKKADEAGGAATLFRAGAGLEDVRERFPEPPAKLKELHQQLMKTFDPDGILNPGRIY